MKLGHTALTLRPNQRTNDSVCVLSAPLEVTCGIELPTPVAPAFEDMLTIEPRFLLSSHCFFIVGYTAQLII
ncbi:hypothetical protein [Bradyrhizobium pachyrhizi]|uniref:hypothetical protein n=1 Tax=Bradyrhizobium pachyrhizi TaxID=280333 RepID=UPI000A47F744|nr:hypothetical protein [Bradyrhizobium pachyrhizi]